MEEKYGSIPTKCDPKKNKNCSSKDPQKDIQDLVKKGFQERLAVVNKRISQNIQQALSNLQLLSAEGSGINIDKLLQEIYADARMNAVTESCRRGDIGTEEVSNDTCNTSYLNKAISDQIKLLDEQIDSGFKVNFKSIWNKLKKYIIGTAVFLIILMILIVVLLIRKASKGGTKTNK